MTELIETPQRFATYRGDVTHTVGEVVGPCRRGLLWKAVTADRDGDATYVGFAPVPPKGRRA